MKSFWMSVVLAWTAGCGHGSPGPVQPIAVKTAPVSAASTATSPPQTAPTTAPEGDGVAEPSSAEEPGPTINGLPREWWLDSDACPKPLAAADRGFGPYDAFVDKALGLPAGPDHLVVMRIGPSFAPSRVLGVIRRSDGTYWFRSTRLTTDVWAQMMNEMHRLQGDSISIDERSQSDALARITTSKVVEERPIPQRTANLLTKLWRALMARAQVTKPIGIATSKLDGTVYELWQGGVGASTHSPDPGSVLGDVVLATEHLERSISKGSANQSTELDVAQKLLQSSLNRTLRKEPCLRRHTVL